MTDNKFTDNEIIKALECCIADNVSCDGCPAIGVCQHDPDCPKSIALDLINRQKAEIERLNEYISRCKSGEEYWVKCLLERPNEAIKEFAERLCEDRVSNDPVVIAVKCELKEMVGEDK